MLAKHIITVLAAAFASGTAIAQPVTTAQFPGTAQIGQATRNVVFRFSCAMDRGKINNLATEIDVPDTPALKNVFAFDEYEGPGAPSAKAHFVAMAGQAAATIDFGYTGSFGNNGSPVSTFTFSLAMTPSAKANLQHLQGIVETLGSGPGHLSTTIANPRKGGPAIEVMADISDAQAAQIKSAMAPCRGPR